jgi:hypothetical protein
MKTSLAVAFAALLLPLAARPAVARPADPPVQSDRGFLDISSDPPAKIIIDGADTGRVTPQHRLELPSGHHKLTLMTLDRAHQRSIGFTVQPGQTTQLTIHLAS